MCWPSGFECHPGNLIGLGLVKNGNGVMAVAGNNSYNGVRQLAGGVLNVANLSDYGMNGSHGNRGIDADVPMDVASCFRGGTCYTLAPLHNRPPSNRISTTGGGAIIDARVASDGILLSFTATSSPNSSRIR